MECPCGSHPGLGDLLDLLDLLIRESVEVAHDVGTVPLILLQHGLQQQPRVPVPVMVAAEKTAASPHRLRVKGEKKVYAYYKQFFFYHTNQ